MASATLSSTQINASTWHYDLTLLDTGTTNIGTFWFAWVPGQDFMPTSPANIIAPVSWTDSITGGGAGDGFAIRWIAGAGAALTPGQSVAGFSFDSATTPGQMSGLSPFFPTQPVEKSFVYSGGPFSDAGFQFVVQTTPEPASWMLFATAACGLISIGRRKRNSVRRPPN